MCVNQCHFETTFSFDFEIIYAFLLHSGTLKNITFFILLCGL